MGNEPASQKPSHSNLDAAQFKPGFLILLCLGLASCRGVKRSDSGEKRYWQNVCVNTRKWLDRLHARREREDEAVFEEYKGIVAERARNAARRCGSSSLGEHMGFGKATGSEDASASFATKEMQCSPVLIYAFSQDSLKGLAAVAGKEHRSRMEHPNSRKFVSSMHFGRIATRSPYTADGPFWAIADGNEFLRKWQSLSANILS